MPNPYTQGSDSIYQAEHISPVNTGDNIEAKKVANYIWDTNSSTWTRQTVSSGGGGAVTIADGDDVALGAKADASATTDTGTFSLISLFKRLLEKVTTLVAKDFSTSAKQDTGNTSLASLDTKLPAQGQALAAASTPVVLPAAQITALTPPAAITGYATASNQTDKSQFTKITDGTDTALVTASGEQNVLETNSAAIKTAVETIDNIVSGAGINQTQVGGTNIDTNSGTKSAGTQRVVLATDQPQLTNALKVDGSAVTQPVSGTFYQATQPVSYATTGSGTATGALRVELPTNGTGTVGLNAGTNAIGKLSANSGVDIGDVDVTSAVSSTLDHGSNLDIDTSAEQITSTSFACKFGVTLKADITNTGIIYIGNSDVTAGTTAATDGFPLSAGETLTLEVTNANIPYAIASANNQKIYWVGV